MKRVTGKQLLKDFISKSTATQGDWVETDCYLTMYDLTKPHRVTSKLVQRGFG